ncbi:unnamed protein product [Ectocarpus sp. 6 AP-2014]
MICDGGGGGGGGGFPYLGASSREELRRLRLENRNMHLLLVENRELKTQIREEAANAELVQRELRDKLGRVEGKLDEVTGELEAARGRLLLLPPAAAATVTEEATISSRSRGSDSNTIPTSELSSSPTVATVDSAFGTDVSVGDGGGGSDGTGRGGGCSYNSGGTGRSRVTPLDWRRRPEKAVCPTMPSKDDLGQKHVTATNGMVTATKGMEQRAAQQGSLEEQRHDYYYYSDEATNSDGDGGDEELEELFRRNERTMQEIRSDLKLLQSDKEIELEHHNNTNNRNNASSNASNDDSDNKGELQVHDKQQPLKAGGGTAETGVGEQLPSRKTPPQALVLGGDNSQRREGGIQIPGSMLQPPQGKVWERNRRYPCSEPPSVSELLLQLRHDDNVRSSSPAVRCSEDGNRKEGDVGNNATNSPPHKGRSTLGASSTEGSDEGDSTRGGGGGGGGTEGVGDADTKGGLITLVASNARALLMS